MLCICVTSRDNIAKRATAHNGRHAHSNLGNIVVMKQQDPFQRELRRLGLELQRLVLTENDVKTLLIRVGKLYTLNFRDKIRLFCSITALTRYTILPILNASVYNTHNGKRNNGDDDDVRKGIRWLERWI